MSSAFVEFSVKFDILQSAIVHVRAERGYRYVEYVSHEEYRHAENITYRNDILREESEHHRTDLVDDERDDATRERKSEKSCLRADIRKNIDAVVQFSEAR